MSLIKLQGACALLLLASLPVASAQSITGAISGTVVDQTDAAIAGAKVALRSKATGAERSGETNELGRFFFGSLQPGAYTLNIEAPGFRPMERTSINLPAAETVSLGDVRMEVGQVTDSVEVREQGAVIQTQTAERAGVLTNSQVQNLSIRGRNVTSLVSLLPGVVDLDNSEQLTNNWNFYVQGNRRNTNNVTLDGATVNAIGNNFNAVVAVSMDAVAEVKVLLSNYQAEYGRMSGANVAIVTKSGTQQFHGLASYFKRNEALNANDFFNNLLGRPRPRYRFDMWNYQVGGPVYWPGKFNSNKDKLFFFWSQEFWPLTIATPITQRTVPTEAERRGDFSSSIDVNNRQINVNDPLTRRPFPGNIVPASRVDRNGQALLNRFPLPNFFDRGISRGNYNYVFQDAPEVPKRTDTLKIDWNANPTNAFMFSYSRRDDINDGKVGIPAGGGNFDIVRQRSENLGKVFIGRYQRIFSPTLINEFNGSYSTRPLNNTLQDADLKTIQRDSIGFNLGQLTPANNPLNIIPNMTFGGVPNAAQITFDGRLPLTTTHEIVSISNNLTKTFTAHTVKMGFYFDRLWAENQATAGAFNGQFNFGRNVNNPLDTNYAYGNAVVGVFNQYDEPTGRPFPVNIASNTEWFVQDNWRVSRRLTLDFGMRFYWLPQSRVEDDRMAGFWLPAYRPNEAVRLVEPIRQGNARVGRNPNTGEILPGTLIGSIAPGFGDPANGMISPVTDPSVPPALMNNQSVQLGPRAGFAWDPFGSGKTSIRGGFGLFYNRMSHGVVLTDFTTQPPLVNRPTVFFGNMSGLLSSSGVLFPASTIGLDLNAKNPSVMNFSLSAQHDLGRNTVFDVGYSGSLGRHLLWRRNLNAIPFGTNFQASSIDPTTNRPLPPNFLRPVQGWGDILLREPASSSNYHSLQAQLNRRFTRGLQFGLSYTWSKSLDYNSDDGNTVSVLVPVRVWNYGLSSFDRTHVAKLNWLYDLPSTGSNNPFVKAVLNDWQFSGIATFSSGQPLGVGFSTVTATDITGSPSDGARIDINGPAQLSRGDRTFSRFFDTSVFSLPARGTYGTAARTVFRGPGIHNWDLTAFKNFIIKERFHTQFRAEFYNAFNHTQWSGLNTGARFDAQGRQVNAQFGQVTATRPGRRIQLALRLSF
ncbi:MAG: carboxypeptidase-like regulatory domain-containing protein [Bryobacteraceae bacterium]